MFKIFNNKSIFNRISYLFLALIIVIILFISLVYFSNSIEITRPRNHRIDDEYCLLFLKGTNTSYQTIAVIVKCKTFEKPIDDYVYDYDILYPVIDENVVDMIFSQQCMNTKFSSTSKELEMNKNYICSFFIKLYNEDKETNSFQYIKYKITNEGKFEELEKR